MKNKLIDQKVDELIAEVRAAGLPDSAAIDIAVMWFAELETKKAIENWKDEHEAYDESTRID